MMAAIQSYVQNGSRNLRELLKDSRVRLGLRGGSFFLLGLVLSAASLGNVPQPLVLSLVCGLSGAQSCLSALGGGLGYLVFWGKPALMGLTWTAAGLVAALAIGDRKMTKATPLLLPAVSALIVAASGLFFQYYGLEATGFGLYALRIALGAGGTALAQRLARQPGPVTRWLGWGFLVLALAQVVPIPWLNPGHMMAGFLAAGAAFPAAAVAGLALDLSRISPVPMTAAMCLAWLTRLTPGKARHLRALAPMTAYALVMALSGCWEPGPMVPLALGGALSLFYPGPGPAVHRRGETGAAQVRLEIAAGVLEQTRELLLSLEDPPVDGAALVSRCAEQACSGCGSRRSCPEKAQAAAMDPRILYSPLLQESDLPVACRRAGRMLTELHRGREQLRLIESFRSQRRECREAVLQQYRFLGEYARDLADTLGRRPRLGKPRYAPRVAVYANRRQSENGDRCCWFTGTEGRFYVLLCDGMGTGMGAVREGNEAMGLLRGLLTAGFPAEHALLSLNSFCALRGRAGAVTADLAEIDLTTGKASLYKWGAAPSYRVTNLGAEKIGTATPPPGLSVTEGRVAVEKLSLRRGETLVMLSDGVGGEDALKGAVLHPDQPLGEIAAEILELSDLGDGDDATIAVARLTSA